MKYDTVAISPLVYRDLAIENTPMNTVFNFTDYGKGDVYFATPYGTVRIVTIVNTPKDEIYFLSEGKTVGIIKLGGTPNPYRRIVLE